MEEALSQDRTRLCGKCKEGWSACGADSGVGAPLQSPTGTRCFRKCSQQAFRDEPAMGVGVGEMQCYHDNEGTASVWRLTHGLRNGEKETVILV